MGAEVKVTVTGIPDLRAALLSVPQKLRRRVLRNALAVGGRVFQRAARRLAPVLQLPIRRASGQVIRVPGTLQKAISVRTSKLASRRGNVGVFVNVKPLPGAKYKTTKGLLGTKRRTLVRVSQRGAGNPKDPFYWRFQEFRTRNHAGRGFLRAAAQRTAEALSAIVAALGPAVERVLRSKAS